MSLILRRREFLLGLTSALVAAPAIVRAASIMPVRAPLVAVPAYQSPRKLWVVTDINWTTDFLPGVDVFFPRVHLQEVFFVGTPPIDLPVTHLRRGDARSLVVTHYHEFMRPRPSTAEAAVSPAMAMALATNRDILVEVH